MGNTQSDPIKLNVEFKTLLDLGTNSGWPVVLQTNPELNGNNKFSGVIIGVLGEYKKGKSSVLSWLQAIVLNRALKEFADTASVVKQTTGVNFSFIVKNNEATQNSSVAFVDTTGLNTPVEYAMQKNVEEKANDLIGYEKTEMFIQDLVLALSQYVIIVVDRISRSEQNYVIDTVNKVQEKYNGEKFIFVVHNLKSVTDVTHMSTLLNYIKSLFNGNISVDKTTNHQYVVNSSSNKSKSFIRHFLLMNNDSSNGEAYNIKSLKALYNCISILDPVGNNNEVGPEFFKEKANFLLPSYLQNFKTLEFVQGKSNTSGLFGKFIANKTDEGQQLLVSGLKNLERQINEYIPDHTQKEVDDKCVIEVHLAGFLNQNIVNSSQEPEDLKANWVKVKRISATGSNKHAIMVQGHRMIVESDAYVKNFCGQGSFTLQFEYSHKYEKKTTKEMKDGILYITCKKDEQDDE